MIRVRIELVPFGQEHRAETLQLLTIANIGGTHDMGEYECVLHGRSNLLAKAYVSEWPRLEKDAAALVHEALTLMGYGMPR